MKHPTIHSMWAKFLHYGLYMHVLSSNLWAMIHILFWSTLTLNGPAFNSAWKWEGVFGLMITTSWEVGIGSQHYVFAGKGIHFVWPNKESQRRYCIHVTAHNIVTSFIFFELQCYSKFWYDHVPLLTNKHLTDSHGKPHAFDITY